MLVTLVGAGGIIMFILAKNGQLEPKIAVGIVVVIITGMVVILGVLLVGSVGNVASGVSGC